MGFISDLIAKLRGKSSSNAQNQTIDAARISHVLNSNTKKHDQLREQLFDGKAAAYPIGSYVKPATRDADGSLALHLSPSERMIIWLAEQSPEIVDSVAQNLNWDDAEDVILWLLRQKTTDAATAVKLFLKAEPGYYAIDGVGPPEGFAKDVIEAFSSNWIAGHYTRGTVGYDPTIPKFTRDQMMEIYGMPEVRNSKGEVETFNGMTEIKELERLEIEKRSKGGLPWPPLSGLAGPFAGPIPKEDVSEYFKKDRDAYFTIRFLLGGLGTWLMDDEIDDNTYRKWLLAKGFVDEAENL